jgi:hypothetical protein
MPKYCLLTQNAAFPFLQKAHHPLTGNSGAKSLQTPPFARLIKHFLSFSANRLHENEVSQLRANGQPRIANQANKIRLAGKQPNDLFLAQPDFAQAVLNVWCRA